MVWPNYLVLSSSVEVLVDPADFGGRVGNITISNGLESAKTKRLFYTKRTLPRVVIFLFSKKNQSAGDSFSF